MITFSKVKFSAREVALVGVMAATLECGKLILSAIANVEVVTILCAIYGYVFGWYGMISAMIFTCVEILVFGINSWVITYLIYWPLVAFVFMLLAKIKISGRIIPTAVAVGLTAFFGVLSSVIDTAYWSGINENFFKNVLIMYIRGVPFFLIHIGCNLAVFSTLFPFLVRKTTQIKAMCRF